MSFKKHMLVIGETYTIKRGGDALYTLERTSEDFCLVRDFHNLYKGQVFGMDKVLKNLNDNRWTLDTTSLHKLGTEQNSIDNYSIF